MFALYHRYCYAIHLFFDITLTFIYIFFGDITQKIGLGKDNTGVDSIEAVVIDILGANVGNDTLGIQRLCDRASGIDASGIDAIGMRTMGMYMMGTDKIGVDAMDLLHVPYVQLLWLSQYALLKAGIIMGFLRPNFVNDNSVLNFDLRSLIFGLSLTICYISL